MNVVPTDIVDVKLIEPRVFPDERGFFMESFNRRAWEQETGISGRFVQDNHSWSEKNVVRGLHYQIIEPQGKLVRVVTGEVFNVAVDLRRKSSTFAKWVGVRLNAENRHQLWIPVGFAHGFQVLSDYADVLYKTTSYYHPQGERSLLWNDPELDIAWPVRENVCLSAKDREAVRFKDANYFV